MDANKVLVEIDKNGEQILGILPLLKPVEAVANNGPMPIGEIRDPIFDYRNQVSIRRGF